MKLIAVTDIFGKTTAFCNLIEILSISYESVEIIDPYQGDDLQFTNENEAYKYFQKRVGLEKYTELLLSKLHGKKNSNQILLGFSVGASAVWAASHRLSCFRKTKGICFYSSQIRHYLEVCPKIEIDLYFSKYESTYDVAEINSRLSTKTNVRCYTTSYLHGFMNEKSHDFNREGYSKYINTLKFAYPVHEHRLS